MSQPYPNILVFVDFPVDDVEAASDFYRTVMGWEVETRIPGIFNRIVPGQNFKVDDGSQGPTGNLHMGISYAGDARPDPRDDADRESPKRRLHDGGRTTRAWILVSDDDEMDAIMDRAVANGGTELWRHHFWTEFGGANASFLDPWGNQLMLWEHLDGIEQDEETHELVGDAKVETDRLGVPDVEEAVRLRRESGLDSAVVGTVGAVRSEHLTDEVGARIAGRARAFLTGRRVHPVIQPGSGADCNDRSDMDA